MAKMWPRKLPIDILENPLRNSEIKVFNKLQNQLGDRFVVFYSRPWLGLKPNGEEIDGECDFVIADPESGVLVIEVKGGGIRHDPISGTWTSTDRMGFRHRIKNPVEQARSSKHILLEKLKRSHGGFQRYIHIRHCVIFPDSSKPGQDLAPDMPLEMFCFIEDFEDNFIHWIKSRLTFPEINQGQTRPLGNDGIRALENLLARPFHLRTPLGHILKESEKEIQILTQQQYHILNAIREIQRAAIAGSAGTGKTVLAMEEAVRFSESGARTLFTCFNRALADFVRKSIQNSSLLHVSGFHGWCFSIIKEAGFERPTGRIPGNFFEETLPELTLQALELLPEQRFDAIVIDEGQDFLPFWWPVLDAALSENGPKLLRVFYDDNQKVYGKRLSLPTEIIAVPIRLGFNLRNTKRIHEVSRQYYRGPEVTAIGPWGLPVDWIKVNVENQIWVKSLNCARHMIGTDGVLPEDLAILVINEDEIRILEDQKNISGCHLKTCRCDNPLVGHVVIDTLRRFKGLERSVVIMPASKALMREPELVYVGLTRARTHLSIVGEESVVEQIKI